MSCNCEGKTINIGMGCCQPVLGPVENYHTKWETERYVSGYTYSKEEIDEKTSGETSGCCITPEEVDEKIASAKTEIEQEIPSLSGYATEEWVLDQQYITGVDLSNYALKSEIPTVPTSNTAFTNDAGYLTEHQSLSGYATEEYVSSYTYDKQTIDEKVAGGGTFDPTQYYNKTATDALLAEKVSESDFQTLSGVVTSHTSNSDIHVTSTDKTNWNAKPDVVMCTEAEWQNISGNTQTGTIYLVY